MSKAEEFIKAKTKIGSNTTKGWRRNGVSVPSYSLPWLTPNDAKSAVEIAREEMIEWLKDNASNYIINTTPSYPDADFSAFVGGKCWEDLKQAMKDE